MKKTIYTVLALVFAVTAFGVPQGMANVTTRAGIDALMCVIDTVTGTARFTSQPTIVIDPDPIIISDSPGVYTSTYKGKTYTGTPREIACAAARDNAARNCNGQLGACGEVVEGEVTPISADIRCTVTCLCETCGT